MSPEEITRTVLDSLALAWRSTVTTIERISGSAGGTIHLIGGGSAIPLLRRLCASACERPVVAGPVEATVVGNAIVQAVADGVLSDVAHGRSLVDADADDRTSRAGSRTLDWGALAERVAGSSRPGGDRRFHRRRSHDEFGVEQDLLVDVGLVGVTLGEQQLGGRATEELAGLTHRAERHRCGAGELDVVVADDGQIAGYVDPDARHLLQQAEGEQVVGAEGGGWPAGSGQPGDPLTGPTALGDVEGRRLQDEQIRGIPSGTPASPGGRRASDR